MGKEYACKSHRNFSMYFSFFKINYFSPKLVKSINTYVLECFSKKKIFLKKKVNWKFRLVLHICSFHHVHIFFVISATTTRFILLCEWKQKWSSNGLLLSKGIGLWEWRRLGRSCWSITSVVNRLDSIEDWGVALS